MMSVTSLDFLLLLLSTIGSTHLERDFTCPYAGVNEPAIPAMSVCDGTVDCPILAGGNTNWNTHDENPEICAPLPYLEKENVLDVGNVTSTTAHFFWSETTRDLPSQSLKLAGYFLTGYSSRLSFEDTLQRNVSSYEKDSLNPWTNYTVLLRPFYTQSGNFEGPRKIGRAVSVAFRTMAYEPDVPSQVSVLSTQPDNVVLNIVGPSAWNSVPIGFHVHWEKKQSERDRSPGDLYVFVSHREQFEEGKTMNVTLPLLGGKQYRIAVNAVGADDLGRILPSLPKDVEVSVPLG